MIDLLRTIKGSQVYGTTVPNSDTDYFGLYKYPVDTYLGMNHDRQIDISADDVSMEIGRYCQLLLKGSPVQIETLFTPEKYFLFKDKSLDILFDNKNMFLTKKLKNSYTGFIHSQLSKAKNITKRLDWEQNEVERKDVLDFCTVLGANGKTKRFKEFFGNSYNSYIEFKDFMNDKSKIPTITHITHQHLGLAKADAMDTYTMYWLKEGGGGIVDDNSNDVQLRSIPKDAPFMCYLHVNLNAYSQHCKKYKDYTSWLANRNPERYQAIKDTGSIVDLKFFYHTIRLLNTTVEIFADNELVVDRRDRDANYLLNIRNGKISLEELNEKAEKGLLLIEELYQKSTLPEEVDYNLVDELCKKLRG